MEKQRDKQAKRMERKLARQQGLDPLAEREDETAGEFAPPEDQPESTE